MMPLSPKPSETSKQTSSPYGKHIRAILVSATVIAALIAADVLIDRSVDKKERKRRKKTTVSAQVRRTLLGTKGAKKREERRVKELGLDPYDSLNELKADLAAGKLNRIRESDNYDLDPTMADIALKKDRPFYKSLHPHTKALLDDIGHAFESAFGEEFIVTSLSRTKPYVRQLRKGDATHKPNPNASLTSTHLYGVAFDVTYKEMTEEQIAWLSTHLALREQRGEIQATREVSQACFHVVDRHAHAR